jgi:hypothetical protein
MRFAILAALLALPVQLTAAGNFFPLEPGNAWVYRAANRDDTITIRVGLTPQLVNGQVYHRLTGYGVQPLWVRTDDSGDLYYIEGDTYREILLTSFRPSASDWFPAPERLCQQEGQAQPKRVRYTGPAGRYDSVLSVQYRVFGCADAGVVEEQYAENIGMIRRVVGSIAGPITYDLVHATSGPLTIAEKPGASFRVGLRQQPERVIATLRLTIEGGMPQELTFPTSQEFDVVLRNGYGQEIWRWSQGYAFAQAVHSKIVGELTHTAEIPLVQNGQRLPNGAYTVEAWLTTQEPRRYAAAVSVEIR